MKTLYYRLQVFDIRIPPLRERSGDILLLADAFLEEISRSTGRPPVTLTQDAQELLLAYAWPGNVRELHNALERAAVLSDGSPITTQHLSLQSDVKHATNRLDLSAVESHTIEQAMRETNWNKSKAATRLGITRTQLYVRLRKYGFETRELS